MDINFVCLSPNLALDRTLKLQHPLNPESNSELKSSPNLGLTPGSLHRVAELREAAGGKAVNVARVLKTLGEDAIVAGFLAGFNGKKFRSLLAKDNLKGLFEDVEGETRECHILLDTVGQVTEVYESGPTVLQDAWQALLTKLPECQLIISGSLAQGLSTIEFSSILKNLPHKPIVDASGTVLQVALEAGVALVKPNKAELASIIPIKNNGIPEAQELYQTYGVPILLSLGAEGLAYVGEETLFVEAPKIVVTNPVASGDSVLAAFLWAKNQGWPLKESLRLAVAAGSENAASGGGARFTKKTLFLRYKDVQAPSYIAPI